MLAGHTQSVIAPLLAALVRVPVQSSHADAPRYELAAHVHAATVVDPAAAVPEFAQSTHVAALSRAP